MLCSSSCYVSYPMPHCILNTKWLMFALTVMIAFTLQRSKNYDRRTINQYASLSLLTFGSSDVLSRYSTVHPRVRVWWVVGGRKKLSKIHSRFGPTNTHTHTHTHKYSSMNYTHVLFTCPNTSKGIRPSRIYRI